MMNTGYKNFEERLKQHAGEFAKVVPFEPEDKFLLMDFTEKNTELADEILLNTDLFIQYINKKLLNANAKYGIGGWGEDRAIYRRSAIFGPSPTTNLFLQDGAEAPSRCEGENERVSGIKQNITGYEHADPFLYSMLKEYALKNRSVPTEAEAVLWKKLKTKQLCEYKFRRQHIIDKFITDFVCLKKRLVIEVDGLIHQLPENQLSDEERTRVLNSLDFDVLRFTNDEVLRDIDNVLKKILETLESKKVQLPSLKIENTRFEDTQPSNKNIIPQNAPSSQSKVRAAGGLPGGPAQAGGMGRSIHLGTDIWGKPYTKIMAPLNGIVHSFAFNNAFGDYGATIILTHRLEDFSFHTLYGHLSLNSIKNIQEGELVKRGDVFAEFGIPFENGQWPPHLHFQIIRDLQGMKGDYTGVCKYSEREKYLANCPDPDLILGMMQYAS